MFSVQNQEIIPKTACFFSENLDVYIDTSDGVNDDLQIQEYAARAIKCTLISQGKRFLFFKCAHSNKWSSNIKKVVESSNGKVIPFFKWSFNDNFYNHVASNISSIRSKPTQASSNIDLGLFADFNKKERIEFINFICETRKAMKEVLNIKYIQIISF